MSRPRCRICNTDALVTTDVTPALGDAVEELALCPDCRRCAEDLGLLLGEAFARMAALIWRRGGGAS